MIIQLCGMSGAGKTTLSEAVRNALESEGIQTEVIDADDIRTNVLKELGYTKEDRNDNIRRLAFLAQKFSKHGIVTLISAINPYDAVRTEVKNKYPNVYTVYINCDLDTLVQRDTKGLYKRALLPDGHQDKIYNLTGVNDPFEIPEFMDLEIFTNKETLHESTQRFVSFVKAKL